MKRLSKLVLREHIQQDEILNKKGQKWILGGFFGGYDCYCGYPSQYCCTGSSHMDCAAKCVDYCNTHNCG